MKKLLILLLLSTSLSAFADVSAIPENAFSSGGSTWWCNNGYLKQGNVCLKKPYGARWSNFYNTWTCLDGRELVDYELIGKLVSGGRCKKCQNLDLCKQPHEMSFKDLKKAYEKKIADAIKAEEKRKIAEAKRIADLPEIPKNAYRSGGSTWFCNKGYQREGNICLSKEEKRKAREEDAKAKGYSSYSEMQAEEKRIYEIKKEERSIENYIKKLKEHIKKLQDLELDSLKVEAEQLISEIESLNTSSDLSVLQSRRNRLSVLNSSVELKIKAEEKRIADAKKAEEKRIADAKKAEEKLNMKLSLIPPKTELQKAQNFLNDIQVFVEYYPDEFDIVEVTEFMIQSKPILDGSFQTKDRKNIEAFKRFAETSSNFRGFRQKRLELETQNEVQKIDKIMKTLASNIKLLGNYRNNNSLFSSSIKSLIQTSRSILDNPKTLSELQNAVKSTSLLLDEIYSTPKLIKIANSQIAELTAYLAKNMTSDFAPEVLSKLKELKNAIREKTLKEKIAQQESPSEYLGNITRKVDVFISANIAQKKVATTIVSDTKKVEDKRKEEENEEGHFFANMICEEAENSAGPIPNEIVSLLPALGIGSSTGSDFNSSFNTKMCDCVQKRTRLRISPERIKEVNRKYKINPNADNLINDSEALFFATLAVTCSLF